MEYKELKKKNESQLHRILAEQREKLRDLRFKDANKQLKNIREIRQIRTIIAQIMTLLNLNNTADAEKNSEKPVEQDKEKNNKDK